MKKKVQKKRAKPIVINSVDEDLRQRIDNEIEPVIKDLKKRVENLEEVIERNMKPETKQNYKQIVRTSDAKGTAIPTPEEEEGSQP